MEELNLNKILNREQQEKEIKNILKEFESNKNNLLFKKGIYVYGHPGTGKTTFVANILKDLNYDIIKYDAGDIRNTSVIEHITKHNMSDKNIMSLLNPIICIGNYRIDKKIKELMKVCNTVELKTPNSLEVSNIINKLMPSVDGEIKTKLIHYIQGDLRKLNNMYHFNKNKPELFTCQNLENIFQIKSYNDDTKKITNKLINKHFPLSEHNNIINETDRTSVGLLWHEKKIFVLLTILTELHFKNKYGNLMK